jgi:hypothetical protein
MTARWTTYGRAARPRVALPSKRPLVPLRDQDQAEINAILTQIAAEAIRQMETIDPTFEKEEE